MQVSKKNQLSYSYIGN